MNRIYIYTFLYLLCTNYIIAQKIEILNRSELTNLPIGKKFAFIEPKTTNNNIVFVATIKAVHKSKNSSIENLYFAIRKQANKVGANCYKINSYKKDSILKEDVLILDSYFASDEVLTENTENHEKNVVFIFGNERSNENSITFKLNGIQKEIKPGTFYKITLKENEEIKISKGGFAGETMWLKWKQNKQPLFYTLSGFGLSELSKQPMNGISFSTGRINNISNINVGLLLTQLLKECNY